MTRTDKYVGLDVPQATTLGSRRGNTGDQVDADGLSAQLWRGGLRAVYHGSAEPATLKELTRAYRNLVEDATRVLLRLKALFRARAITTPGTRVYQLRDRATGRVMGDALPMRRRSRGLPGRGRHAPNWSSFSHRRDHVPDCRDHCLRTVLVDVVACALDDPVVRVGGGSGQLFLQFHPGAPQGGIALGGDAGHCRGHAGGQNHHRGARSRWCISRTRFKCRWSGTGLQLRNSHRTPKVLA